jgi:uncharacterized protein (TIGR02171 family)
MKYLLAFILSLFIISCSNSESAQPSEQISNEEADNSVQGDSLSTIIEIEGMNHLEGGSVTIGTNDKSFKANERPAMKVLLDYDFYMGIHEVTCGEYASVAKKAKLKTFGKCENDSLPLTDITYYDAILFANAKSKLEESDTAYTYSKAIFDNDGHCTNLEGFAFHAEAMAYRLPTEAEWVYSATKAWNTKNSWNNSNSEYKLHLVCSKGTDSAGFCDMAGNAMEWVNDWMGTFRDTTVTNYTGAPDGGDIGERVVKGGSYSSSEKELTPYSRGDVYTVTSATRAEYVGFRLAFGSIPNALWLNEDGTSTTSIVTSLVGPETIKNLAGTYNTKLAFRNDISGNISYLDYRNGSLSIKEITKGISAFHPEISPDGNWIAFCTGFEGVAGKSTIYVQSLEGEETIQVKLKAESATIPRWRVLENGDTVIVYVNDAGNNKNEAEFKGNSTWQVKFAKGKFGTPQKLFDGAYHGGISEDRTLAVSGARILRARVAKKGSTVTDKANDVVWYDSAQACNVSLSQDGTKRTAFLDFAGKPGKKFADENYATHERVFIADSNGKLIQSIKAPSGYTFDHTEWASDGEKSIIVATLANPNGAHTKIAIIDPADSSITEIAEGDELWHPNLWIKKNINKSISDSDSLPAEQGFKLDPDSAGMYYNSSGAYNRAIQWRYKMELLWQYRNTATLTILGSSHTFFGVNPQFFDKSIIAINLATPSNTLGGTYFFFNNYVFNHMKKTKVIVISVDIDIWYTSSMSMFDEAYLSYPGYVYDKNHNFWKEAYPEGLAELTYNSPGTSSGEKLRKTLGFSEKKANAWGEPTVKQDSNWMESKFKEYYENFEMLKDIAKKCFQRDIILIGVITPQNPKYKETGAFGFHGLLRSETPTLIQEIADISKTYPNFILLDENNMGYHDYTDEMAYDTDHLSHYGAEKLTHRLDSLIKTLNIQFEQ